MQFPLLRLVICFLLCTFTSLTYSSQTPPDLATTTQKLLTLTSTPGKNLTTEEQKAATTTATTRNEYFKNNLTHPELFSKWLLPNKLTTNIPAEAQAYLEKEVTNLEGTLEIRAATEKQSEPIQYLLHQDNTTYYLHFIGEAPDNLKTDARVRIDHAFQIPTNSNATHLVLGAENISILKNVSALPLSFGPQSTITILVNFQDKPTDRPFTPATIDTLFFKNINDWYYEASYHQTTFVGQVAGWYGSNVPSTTNCDDLTDLISAQADQAAINAGIDLSKFRHKVYIFPKTSSCGWLGLGTVGGSSTKAWINGTSALWVSAHELGHNLGLWHSHSLRCPNSPIEGDCTEIEYGDGSDVMGNINPGHFSAYQKDRLGWLNYQVSPPITTVTQSGTYLIDPYETLNNKPKALKLLKRAGGTDYYYLEFRQNIGFDKVLADCGSNCDYTKGVVFHQGNSTNGSKNDLLDMSPGGGNQLVALLPCKSWTDPGAPNGGVTFSVQSITAQGAKVRITYGGQKARCVRSEPTLKTLPTYTPWLSIGENTTYKITIKNNDSENCSARNFSFILPVNIKEISTQLNNSSLQLKSGETKQISFIAKSNYTTTSRIYPLNLTMKDNIENKNVLIPINVGLQK